MEKRFITAAMVELRRAITEAEEISAKPELSKRDEARINVLLAKIAALKSGAVAPDDFNKRFWNAFLKGQDLPVEARADLIAGSQSFTFSAGAQGGVLVPQEFHDEIILGLSANDPLLNPELVTLVVSSKALRPYSVPGWDLSTFAAVKVAEGVQQNPQTPPPASNVQLGGYKYKATLDASFEFEEDEFQPTINSMQKAYAQGFAKGIGVDLITGNGTTAPQGVLTGAVDSGFTTATTGNVITAPDIESIYFKLDEAYRNAPKCAWVISDTIYQSIRKAVDGNNRPLINVVGDKKLLMDKPVLIAPSMPSTGGSHGIVFGDLSHYVVRVTQLTVDRNLQAPGYVENGKGLYTGYMRADAKVIDPTGGTKPAIIFATLHV